MPRIFKELISQEHIARSLASAGRKVLVERKAMRVKLFVECAQVTRCWPTTFHIARRWKCRQHPMASTSLPAFSRTLAPRTKNRLCAITVEQRRMPLLPAPKSCSTKVSGSASAMPIDQRDVMPRQLMGVTRRIRRSRTDLDDGIAGDANMKRTCCGWVNHWHQPKVTLIFDVDTPPLDSA